MTMAPTTSSYQSPQQNFPQWMYLENSLNFGGETVTNSTPSFTQGDVLANMMYFYLVFLLVVIVLGGLGFSIREYAASVALKTSPTSFIIRGANWTSETTSAEDLPEKPAPTTDPDPQQPTASGLVQEKLESCRNQETTSENLDPLDIEMSEKGRNDARFAHTTYFRSEDFDEREQKSNQPTLTNSKGSNTNDLALNFENLRLLADDGDSSGFCDSSLAKFICNPEPSSISFKMSTQQEVSKKKKSKKVYSLEACYDIQKEISRSITAKPCRISQLVINTIEIPTTRFTTLWQADRAISEIRSVILDPGDDSNQSAVLKALQVVRMICIGSNPDVMVNPNLFLPQYNDLIETLIDTGAVFDVLDKVPDTAKALFVDNATMHLWHHLNYTDCNTQIIEKEFARLKIESFIEPRKTIFRLFCNLRLGIHLLNASEAVVQRLETQMMMLSSELVRMTRCNEYISLIPMLAQAIDLSVEIQVKYFFYLLSHRIIILHSECCIGECLDDDHLDIKAIIQHGMWKHQHNAIRAIATDTFDVLCLVRPGVRRWLKELASGLIDPSSAVVIELLRTAAVRSHFAETSEEDGWSVSAPLRSTSSSSRLRGRTPGSWDIRE